MKLIVGLGNPGARYQQTRHNVGFMVIDELGRRHALAFEAAPADALMARWRSIDGGAIVAKPLTFMNRSGAAVAELRRYYRIELADLLVVSDEVQLPLGRLRARPRGSAGGHNGLRSIVDALGTVEFARLRIGIGRGDGRRDLADHVLARFEADERPEVEAAVARAADAVTTFVTDGIAVVMNRFNRAEDGEKDTERNGTGAGGP
jgi:PTH1 family peptidyl-tRNA hydrolase